MAEAEESLLSRQQAIIIFNEKKLKIHSSKLFNETATLDEALKKTEFGKFNYYLICVCGLAITNVYLESSSISFVLPVSGCDLNLTTHEKGILGAISFAGIVSSSHLVGFLADTKGRHPVIQITMLAAFAFTILSSFANNFWVFAVLRYFNGFFISGGTGTIFAYLGEFHSAKDRGRVIMAASFIFGLGGFLLPLIAMATINANWSFNISFLGMIYKPWRLFVVICGLPGFFCGLLMYALPESPKFLFLVKKNDETINVLKKIFHWNTGKEENQYIVSKIEDIDEENLKDVTEKVSILKSIWLQTMPLFNKKYARRTIIFCIIQFWTFACCYGTYLWFPLILNSVMEISANHPDKKFSMCHAIYMQNKTSLNGVNNCNEKLESSTFYHTLVLELFYCIGYILIGLIINAINKLHIISVIFLICGICGCLIIYIDIPLVAVYLFIIFLLSGINIPVINAITVDYYPTKLRAMAMCITLMIGRSGSIFGSNLVGAILDNNCETGFWFFGIACASTGFLGYLLPKNKQSGTV